nr:MAG TPA: hypothetical protein [Caudoviricetes sp.]
MVILRVNGKEILQDSFLMEMDLQLILITTGRMKLK